MYLFVLGFLCNFLIKRYGCGFILFFIDLILFVDKKLILYINFCFKKFEELVENKKLF